MNTVFVSSNTAASLREAENASNGIRSQVYIEHLEPSRKDIYSHVHQLTGVGSVYVAELGMTYELSPTNNQREAEFAGYGAEAIVVRCANGDS